MERTSSTRVAAHQQHAGYSRYRLASGSSWVSTGLGGQVRPGANVKLVRDEGGAYLQVEGGRRIRVRRA